MAKNNRRRRVRQEGPARPTPYKSLGHTAGPSYADPVSLADLREAFSLTKTVRSPLIRTVLVEREPFVQPRPRPRGLKPSPVVQARATMRSSDRQTRSPFLNATTVTPELTERAILCAKRTIRREILFATKQTGKGAKSPKRPPSKVKC